MGIEEALGYTFTDKGLLRLALTHRTAVEEAYPGGGAPAHLSQQRLEFLGDALLNYVVGRWLYEQLPLASEGTLTELRAAFVKGSWLRDRGEALGLLGQIQMGRGASAQAATNNRLLEDTVEALIGAVALDGGDEEAAALVRRWLPSEAPAEVPEDPVVAFNLWYQDRYHRSPPAPEYRSEGVDHQRTWTAVISVGDVTVEGSGPNKLEAKRDACRRFMALVEAGEVS